MSSAFNRARRRVLQVGAGLAAACAWPARAELGLRFAQNPFSLGVASGFMQAHSVSLWTRLAPEPLGANGAMAPVSVPVRCEIALDDHFARVVRRIDTVARPEHAHSVHLWPDGLTPGTTYFYRFFAGNAQSAVGRTKTAPALGHQPASLRLALTSCQHFEAGTFKAWRQVAQEDLDCVVFVGDYIYETNYRLSQRVRNHNTSAIPRDLAAYRERYALYKSDPDLQAAHAAHPWVLMWDDHEIENDYASATSARHAQAQQFARQRAAAAQAYWEHQPLPPSFNPVVKPATLNTTLHWGQLAKIITLDTRQHRDVQACPSAPPQRAGGRLIDASSCPELVAPQRSLLGVAQEAWLASQLTSSTASWRLIAQPSQMSPSVVPHPFKGDQTWSDAWDGYPAARERMLRHIAQNGMRNVVTLGGDVHRHVAANLRLQTEPATVAASEFVTSSISSRGMLDAAAALLKSHNPDMLHSRADERGYARITVTAAQVRCDFIGTPHPVRDTAVFRTQTTYTVPQGQPGPQMG